jgi:N4-gp56 family major capsid protein
MPDAFTNTATTNFNKTVVDQILKKVIASLRAGLSFTPRGSVLPAMLMPGGNATFRSIGYSDLPEDGAVSVEDGQADPDVEDLDIDYVEFTGTAKGRTVGVTDNAKARSPHNLAALAVDKVSRDILVSVDNVPRALYAAATPEVFGAGASNATVTSAGTMTAALLKNGVALLRNRNVRPVASGLFAFVASPLVIRDLQGDDEYIEEIKHAEPGSLLTGQIGTYAGAAIIDAGSRGIAKPLAGTDTVFAGTTTGDTTGGAAEDLFTTSVAHGLSVNDPIRFSAKTGGTLPTVGTVYYVKTVNSATTFTLSATVGGAVMEIGATDITAATWGKAIDLQYGTLIGAEACFAALGGLRVIPVTGPDKSDPLDRRDLYSWKGMLGGVLNDLDADRFLNISVATSLHA